MNRRPPQPRRGFTLAETLVSLAIMGVLFIALGSTVMVATTAMPDAKSPLNAMRETSSALDVLTRDLTVSSTIMSASATHIEIQMPVLAADETGKRVRYEWSGTPGHPLTRQVDGGDVVTLVGDVRAFALNYTTRDVTEEVENETVTRSGEMLFAIGEAWPALILPNARTFEVGTVRWFSQRFVIDQVSLPANTTRVGFTRVELTVRRQSGAGPLYVSINKPSAPGSRIPLLTPIGSPSATIRDDLPGAYTPFTFILPADVHTDDSDLAFMIVLTGAADAAADIRYQYSVLGPADSKVVKMTTDGGASWTPAAAAENQNDAIFAVHGWYETTDFAKEDQTTRYLRRVQVHLRAGAESLTRIDTSIAIFNEPVLP